MKTEIKMSLVCALMGMTALVMAHPCAGMPHRPMMPNPEAQVKLVLSQNDMLERFLTLETQQKTLFKDYTKAREDYARSKVDFFKNHRPSLDTAQRLENRRAWAKFEAERLEPLIKARTKFMASLETEQKLMVEKLETAFKHPKGFEKPMMHKDGPHPRHYMQKPTKKS